MSKILAKVVAVKIRLTSFLSSRLLATSWVPERRKPKSMTS